MESRLRSLGRAHLNWLLNGAARLKGRLRGDSLERPLVVTQGGVGDVILLTPLIEALAAGRPRAVDVLAAPGPLAALANNPWVGRVHALAPLDVPAPDLLAELDAARYTAVFAAPVFLMTGLLWRYGVLGRHGRWRSDPLFGTFWPLSRLAGKASRSWRRRVTGRHVADLWYGLLPAAARPASGPPAPRVYPSAEDEAAARAARAGLGDAPFIVLHLGGRDPIRRPAPETLAAVADGAGVRAVLAGSGPEDAAAAGRVRALAPAAVDLVGRLTLLQLYCLLRSARACVAPDSGVMHLAACAGTPLVALMGNQRPAHTGPRAAAGSAVVLDRDPSCSPCTRTTCGVFAGGSCIQSFQAAEILAALARLPRRP